MSPNTPPKGVEEPVVETFDDLLEFRSRFAEILRSLPTSDQEEGKRMLRELDTMYVEGIHGTHRLTEATLRIERLTWALIGTTAVLAALTAILIYGTFWH